MSSQFTDDTGQLKNLVDGDEVVHLPRATFELLLEMTKKAMMLVRTEMADGKFTDKYCNLCLKEAPVMHMTTPPRCPCTCHKVRELLPQLLKL